MAKKASRKPVLRRGKSSRGGRQQKPPIAHKQADRIKLQSKGVSEQKARELTGEDEDIDQEEIARRRIEWQKTLPKA